MSRRQEQFASVLREAIQGVFDRGLQDPRVSGMITVTEVKVSEDFADATIYVSVLPADRQELTLHGIRSAATHIRRQAGDQVRSRKLPRFYFDCDNRPKKQAGVMQAILKAQEEREARGLPPLEPAPAEAAAPAEAPANEPASESAKKAPKKRGGRDA